VALREEPPVTDEELSINDFTMMTGAGIGRTFNVRPALALIEPNDAVTVAGVIDVTMDVLIVKVAVDACAATMTLDGTITA
jgi:hypothetical protein